ncbi:MAG: hypothetical protein H7X86_07225 [Gorillibacterium sp.]|nr:hypothetical protein [Gorillibacterium sp.]
MKSAPEQSYEKHLQLYPIHHFVLAPLSIITFIGTLVYTVSSSIKGDLNFTVIALLALSSMSVLLGFLARRSGLIVQDRVIRAEEQFRHYLLTNKPLDARLSLAQIIALRFASDEEFPALAAKAADKGMLPKEIKKDIRTWRADTHRV